MIKSRYILFLYFFMLVQSFQGQWIWQNPLPQGNHLFGIHFINPSKGWAVGEGGTMLMTTDGVMNWEYHWEENARGMQLYDIFFLDDDNGWASGQLTILKTTNGGQDWELNYTGSYSPIQFHHIF